jgi:hypothetical protein
VSLDPGAARCAVVGERQLGNAKTAAFAQEPNRARVFHDRVELLGHLRYVGVRPSSGVGEGWWSGVSVHEPRGAELGRTLSRCKSAAAFWRLGFQAPKPRQAGSRSATAGVTSSPAGAAMGKREGVRLAASAATPHRECRGEGIVTAEYSTTSTLSTAGCTGAPQVIWIGVPIPKGRPDSPGTGKYPCGSRRPHENGEPPLGGSLFGGRRLTQPVVGAGSFSANTRPALTRGSPLRLPTGFAHGLLGQTVGEGGLRHSASRCKAARRMPAPRRAVGDEFRRPAAS